MFESILNQKFRTKDKMLRYPRIKYRVFTDTLFAIKMLWKYERVYWISQIFLNDLGFIKFVFMKFKGVSCGI